MIQTWSLKPLASIQTIKGKYTSILVFSWTVKLNWIYLFEIDILIDIEKHFASSIEYSWKRTL